MHPAHRRHACALSPAAQHAMRSCRPCHSGSMFDNGAHVLNDQESHCLQGLS